VEAIDELLEMLKESISVGLIYTLVELLTGSFLISMEKELLIVPGLAIMLPGILDLRGNISSTLASRLGSALHMGWMKPKIALSGEARENIIASILLSISMNVITAVLAFLVAAMLGMAADVGKLVLVAVTAGIIASAILMSLTLVITVKSFLHGWDPNNVTIPVIATLGDIVMIGSLVLVVKIFHMVGFI